MHIKYNTIPSESSYCIMLQCAVTYAVTLLARVIRLVCVCVCARFPVWMSAIPSQFNKCGLDVHILWHALAAIPPGLSICPPIYNLSPSVKTLCSQWGAFSWRLPHSFSSYVTWLPFFPHMLQCELFCMWQQCTPPCFTVDSLSCFKVIFIYR